ncbi:Type I secretion system ATP-binding protein PrsD [Methylobacterium crusticola]|uniref:Type I secretion system ATP-binding protein PrsD n=1 Tax=Methylobacterium crusticola TaxID=1697972 RepID=A0ABQ4R7Z8_9HYPH|nr:type I secretion system permease/ATPase [Methylobacterium crusticola]GJD53793.1 Type I secretion system ATP-binding protein PrsD [Methylobacterium crusticola]
MSDDSVIHRARSRETWAAAGAAKAPLAATVAISSAVNLLMLTAPLFMLQVYDRVLPSRSVATLVGLAGVALILFLIQAVLEVFRARILSRFARLTAERLGERLFRQTLHRGIDSAGAEDGQQALRDLDTVRGFLGSPAFTAFFDLPWVPLYVAVCVLFHPWIGAAVAVGAVGLGLLTLLTDWASAGPARAAAEAAAERRSLAGMVQRTAPLVTALGMRARLAAAWAERDRRHLDVAETATDRAIGFGSTSRLLRTVLQSGILALGALLVVRDEATAGVMLAATILSARALAPVDTAIANWKSVAAARQAWTRLVAFLPAREPALPTPLPAPRESLRVTALSVAAPGTHTLVLHDVNVALKAGSALGVIGPSGSGKSTLARALVGLAAPSRGVIRLDGAALDQWEPDALGQALGYLPQDAGLFEGTIAQNITRFDPDPDPEALLRAARSAGVHEIVLRLPCGYDTRIGSGGTGLSGGQTQRVALARALYGDPFLVVLDEPNANLDTEGERALTAAIQAVRARGGIAVVIAHRPSALTAVDRILVLNEGRVQMHGPRDEVLAELGQVARTAAARPPDPPAAAAQAGTRAA